MIYNSFPNIVNLTDPYSYNRMYNPIQVIVSEFYRIYECRGTSSQGWQKERMVWMPTFPQ